MDQGKTLIAPLALLLAVSSCSPGEVDPIEGAVVVPVEVAERDDLAALIAGFAHRNGYYLRDSSNYMKDTTGTFTFYIVAFRGLANGEEWQEIAAHAASDEYPIITFNRPPHSEVEMGADEAWAELVKETSARWPRTAVAPILPHGGVPHARDLVETADGFRIDPAKSVDYELPVGSPLLAHQ